MDWRNGGGLDWRDGGSG
uniref:Uncharacterized protein n=1 Tax=Arundo donax TaxID=35708 RepID=A0A0A9BIJ1_ARUDO